VTKNYGSILCWGFKLEPAAGGVGESLYVKVDISKSSADANWGPAQNSLVDYIRELQGSRSAVTVVPSTVVAVEYLRSVRGLGFFYLAC